jgi:hypothetical protein
MSRESRLTVSRMLLLLPTTVSGGTSIPRSTFCPFEARRRSLPSYTEGRKEGSTAFPAGGAGGVLERS